MSLLLVGAGLVVALTFFANTPAKDAGAASNAEPVARTAPRPAEPVVSPRVDRKRYVYKVFREFVVEPTQVSVTRPVDGRNIVTLQTCTLPDYSRRLIVQAEKVA